MDVCGDGCVWRWMCQLGLKEMLGKRGKKKTSKVIYKKN